MRTRFCNCLMAALRGLTLATAMGTSASAVILFQLASEDLTILSSSVVLGSRTEIIEHTVVTPEGVQEVLKLPGRLVWDNLVLTHPVGTNRALWDWRAQV